MKIDRIAVSLLLLSGGAMAQTAAAAGSDPYLLGNFGGARESLADRGIQFNVGYTSEDFDNVKGGDDHGLVHAGQLSLGSQLDLARLAGIKGATVHVSVTYRDGNNVQDNGVDTLLQPQEIYGRDQTWHLTEMWWGQSLFDNRLDLHLGRLTVGGEFGDVECSFVNQGLCGTQAGNIHGEYWYNWPISQWAAVGRVNIDAQHYIKLGVYQVNPSLLERAHKFTLNPSGTVGALFPVELGWTPQLSGDRAGTYKVGGWYTNADEPDVYEDSEGDPAALSNLAYRMRDGAYGGYFTFEQQLSRGHRDSDKSGLRLFVNGTVADRHTSTVYETFAVGGIYRGLVVSRPQDELGVGASAVWVNPRAQNDEALQYAQGTRANPADHAEYTFETFYGWQALGWLRIQPDLQWIHHPGNTAPDRGAYLIVGAKTSIAF